MYIPRIWDTSIDRTHKHIQHNLHHLNTTTPHQLTESNSALPRRHVLSFNPASPTLLHSQQPQQPLPLPSAPRDRRHDPRNSHNPRTRPQAGSAAVPGCAPLHCVVAPRPKFQKALGRASGGARLAGHVPLPLYYRYRRHLEHRVGS
jgi:hypothetical protein